MSHESDVFSYSECKIAKNFRRFAPGPHSGGFFIFDVHDKPTNAFTVIVWSKLRILGN